ncbi:hypothetical protein OG21DRAFT_1484757 [Imleria badia]|nr:hypothetical protein OG21DRAFT_1484757 [Imleria badia]
MPGPAEGGIAVGIRRLGIMILALVAPEIVVMWAIGQLFAACKVQKRFQKALKDGTLELRVKPRCEPRLVSATVSCDVGEVKITIPEEATKSLGPSSASLRSLQGYCHWTPKHSFYAWMGGFMLFIDKDPALPREVYHPLTPDELLEFLKVDSVHMSMVSEIDLDDRSKGDWLSKMVAVLQLACWRYVDALSISILSCFIYAFWWHKPKDVHCPVPVRVYWKESGEFPKIKYRYI